MSCLNLLKRKGRGLLILSITVLGSFLFLSKISAESIKPNSTEVTLSIGETSRHTVTIENEKDYDIYVTPKLYKYYPQSEYVLDLEPFEEFVVIDTDYITIPSNTSVDIPFQIMGLESLEVGTYYNLIVFEHLGQRKNDENYIGASGALSHIVKLNLTASPNMERITEDYSIEIQVINRGIPFIKPTILKLLVFNNSPYTLIPKGEIQVVKRSGNKEPEYIKINLDRTRVYPQDTLEKEYSVENWYLEDIFFGKTAYLKIENGLDDNIISKEIKIPGFKNEFIYILATLTIVILLTRSLKNNSKSEPEPAE